MLGREGPSPVGLHHLMSVAGDKGGLAIWAGGAGEEVVVTEATCMKGLDLSTWGSSLKRSRGEALEGS